MSERDIEQDELYFEHWPDSHTAQVDLRYPRLSHYKFIQIGLSDIRATNDIRVSFDFERSGWKVERPMYRDDPDGNQTCEWEEVAIVYDWEEGEESAQSDSAIPQI